MGQSVSALKCCFGRNSSSYNIKTMTNTEDDRDLCNEEPFGEATFTLSPLAFGDQYDMQEKLEKLKGRITFNADRSITLSTDSYADGYETIQQCFKSQQEERLSNASACDDATPAVVDEQNNEASQNGSEHTEGATNISQPPPPPNPVKHQKRDRRLVKNLTPQANDTSHSGRVVDQSLSQKLSVDEHIWHYVSFERALKVSDILAKNNCVAKLVPEFSKEGVSYFLEVSPYKHDSYNETDAKNAVENAAEEFAELFQKIYAQSVVEDSVRLPLGLDKEKVNDLETSLKRMGFLLIESDLRRLIGPEIHLQEAKNKVWEVISKHQRQSQSAFKDFKDTGKELRFETPNGLSVVVSQGDLVKQRVDAIVNPANGDLRHGGGAARAISEAAGHELENECRDFISRGGSLSTTYVMHSTAGKLRPNIKFVIHAVGPKKSNFTSNEDLYQNVKTTVHNCLHYANSKLEIQSVAIPAISSGIYGVPLDIVAKASFDALVDFDKSLSKGQKVLREIHFLNNDKPTASGMRTAFANFANKTFGSSVDPIATDNNEICNYAAAFGRQRIPTKPDKNCFVMAIATALQRDLKRKIDWQNVEDQIKRELKNSKLYKDFQVKTEGNFTYWLKNIFKPSFLDSEQNADLLLSAAANALQVEIILVQVDDDKEPFERNFKPQSSSQKSFDSIYISCDYLEHSHFDALVKYSEGESSAHDLRDGSYTQNHGKQHLRNSSSTSNDSGKIDEKSKPLNSSSNNGSSDNMNAGNNPHSSKEDNMCIICMDEITDVKELPCKHRFCRECIDNCFEKHQPKCPSCGKVFGVLKGNQPHGTMNVREYKYPNLPGYTHCGTIEIQYSFHSGTQKENHPNPGQSYRGTNRTAYLPANKEGREVLALLKRAFESKLLFTIGRSNTTGHENVVIWNDVHHKTSINGQYGYPDDTYLKRVKEELAAKGIQ